MSLDIDKTAIAAISAVSSVTAILKGRFPNLTTEETVNMAAEIVTTVCASLKKAGA